MRRPCEADDRSSMTEEDSARLTNFRRQILSTNSETPKIPKSMKARKKAVLSMPMTKAQMAAELQSLQRQRAIILKSRNMQANRLQAIVAGTLGYDSKASDKERQKKFSEATKVIEGVCTGKEKHPLEKVIKTTVYGIDSFNNLKEDIEAGMKSFAKRLPVADWVLEKDRRGFGLLFLAITIGETGDLDVYANPAKVWKRMGCAPHTFDGQTLMGATWRGGRQGKLPAEEWEKFGYSPRRRSIAYLIGEGLMKQNFTTVKSVADPVEVTDGDADKDTEEVKQEMIKTVTWKGPYRVRYEEARLRYKELHPDYPDLRLHRHGMLVATKMLLKHLWSEWTGKRDEPEWTPERIESVKMKRAENQTT